MANIGIKAKKYVSGVLIPIIQGLLTSNYGDEYHGLLTDEGGSGNTVLSLTEGQSESFAQDTLDKADTVTVDVVGLKITVTVGTLLNDSTTLKPNPSVARFVKVAVLINSQTKALELGIFVRDDDEGYGAVPAGKILGADLKEWQLPHGANTMTEVKSWL